MPPALWFSDKVSVAACRLGDSVPIEPVGTDRWDVFHTSLLDEENIGEVGNDRAAIIVEHLLRIQVVLAPSIEVWLGGSSIEQSVVLWDIPKGLVPGATGTIDLIKSLVRTTLIPAGHHEWLRHPYITTPKTIR